MVALGDRGRAGERISIRQAQHEAIVQPKPETCTIQQLTENLQERVEALKTLKALLSKETAEAVKKAQHAAAAAAAQQAGGKDAQIKRRRGKAGRAQEQGQDGAGEPDWASRGRVAASTYAALTCITSAAELWPPAWAIKHDKPVSLSALTLSPQLCCSQPLLAQHIDRCLHGQPSYTTELSLQVDSLQPAPGMPQEADLAPWDPQDAAQQHSPASGTHSDDDDVDGLEVGTWLASSLAPVLVLQQQDDGSGGTSVTGGHVLLGDEEEDVGCLDDWLEEVPLPSYLGGPLLGAPAPVRPPSAQLPAPDPPAPAAGTGTSTGQRAVQASGRPAVQPEGPLQHTEAAAAQVPAAQPALPQLSDQQMQQQGQPPPAAELDMQLAGADPGETTVTEEQQILTAAVTLAVQSTAAPAACSPAWVAAGMQQPGDHEPQAEQQDMAVHASVVEPAVTTLAPQSKPQLSTVSCYRPQETSARGVSGMANLLGDAQGVAPSMQLNVHDSGDPRHPSFIDPAARGCAAAQAPQLQGYAQDAAALWEELDDDMHVEVCEGGEDDQAGCQQHEQDRRHSSIPYHNTPGDVSGSATGRTPAGLKNTRVDLCAVLLGGSQLGGDMDIAGQPLQPSDPQSSRVSPDKAGLMTSVTYVPPPQQPPCIAHPTQQQQLQQQQLRVPQLSRRHACYTQLVAAAPTTAHATGMPPAMPADRQLVSAADGDEIMVEQDSAEQQQVVPASQGKQHAGTGSHARMVPKLRSHLPLQLAPGPAATTAPGARRPALHTSMLQQQQEGDEGDDMIIDIEEDQVGSASSQQPLTVMQQSQSTGASQGQRAIPALKRRAAAAMSTQMPPPHAAGHSNCSEPAPEAADEREQGGRVPGADGAAEQAAAASGPRAVPAIMKRRPAQPVAPLQRQQAQAGGLSVDDSVSIEDVGDGELELLSSQGPSTNKKSQKRSQAHNTSSSQAPAPSQPRLPVATRLKQRMKNKQNAGTSGAGGKSGDGQPSWLHEPLASYTLRPNLDLAHLTALDPSVLLQRLSQEKPRWRPVGNPAQLLVKPPPPIDTTVLEARAQACIVRQQRLKELEEGSGTGGAYSGLIPPEDKQMEAAMAAARQLLRAALFHKPQVVEELDKQPNILGWPRLLPPPPPPAQPALPPGLLQVPSQMHAAPHQHLQQQRLQHLPQQPLQQHQQGSTSLLPGGPQQQLVLGQACSSGFPLVSCAVDDSDDELDDEMLAAINAAEQQFLAKQAQRVGQAPGGAGTAVPVSGQPPSGLSVRHNINHNPAAACPTNPVPQPAHQHGSGSEGRVHAPGLRSGAVGQGTGAGPGTPPVVSALDECELGRQAAAGRASGRGLGERPAAGTSTTHTSSAGALELSAAKHAGPVQREGEGAAGRLRLCDQLSPTRLGLMDPRRQHQLQVEPSTCVAMYDVEGDSQVPTGHARNPHLQHQAPAPAGLNQPRGNAAYPATHQHAGQQYPGQLEGAHGHMEQEGQAGCGPDPDTELFAMLVAEHTSMSQQSARVAHHHHPATSMSMSMGVSMSAYGRRPASPGTTSAAAAPARCMGGGGWGQDEEEEEVVCVIEEEEDEGEQLTANLAPVGAPYLPAPVVAMAPISNTCSAEVAAGQATPYRDDGSPVLSMTIPLSISTSQHPLQEDMQQQPMQLPSLVAEGAPSQQPCHGQPHETPHFRRASPLGAPGASVAGAADPAEEEGEEVWTESSHLPQEEGEEEDVEVVVVEGDTPDSPGAVTQMTMTLHTQSQPQHYHPAPGFGSDSPTTSQQREDPPAVSQSIWGMHDDDDEEDPECDIRVMLCEDMDEDMDEAALLAAARLAVARLTDVQLHVVAAAAGVPSQPCPSVSVTTTTALQAEQMPGQEGESRAPEPSLGQDGHLLEQPCNVLLDDDMHAGAAVLPHSYTAAAAAAAHVECISAAATAEAAEPVEADPADHAQVVLTATAGGAGQLAPVNPALPATNPGGAQPVAKALRPGVRSSRARAREELQEQLIKEILRMHHRSRVDLKTLVTLLTSLLTDHASKATVALPGLQVSATQQPRTGGGDGEPPAAKRARTNEAGPAAGRGVAQGVAVQLSLDALITEALSQKDRFGQHVVITPHRLFLALLSLAYKVNSGAPQSDGSSDGGQCLPGMLVSFSASADGAGSEHSVKGAPTGTGVQLTLLHHNR